MKILVVEYRFVIFLSSKFNKNYESIKINLFFNELIPYMCRYKADYSKKMKSNSLALH